jgi:hypothetical protein
MGILASLALETLRDELVSGQLPARIRALRDGGPTERMVGQALGADLAFLRRHPDALFACLWARLAWTEALAPVLARWRAAQTSPWLRSLRAPDPALASALVAELRLAPPADWRQQTRLFGFARDAGALVIRHPDAATAQRWILATGELLDDDAADYAPSLEPAQMIRRDHPALQAVLARHGEPPDTQFVYGAVSDDGALVAVVAVDEQDEVAGHLRLYRAGEQIYEQWPCWPSVEIAFYGPRLMLVGSSDHGVLILDTQRAQLVLSAYAAAVSPDGLIATVDREGTAVRVWDAAALDEPVRAGELPTTFSPDGRRVVVGGDLCDGETGRVVATIGDPSGGVYLEGGPPHHWFWCGTRYVVSLRHSARWDTETGERGPLGRLGFHGHWVVGAWDGTGTYRVRAPRRGGPLVVQDAATGAVVAELPARVVTACALSPGGTWCAGGDEDGTVALFQCATGHRRVVHAHASAVAMLAFVERAGQLIVVSAGAKGSLVAHTLEGALVCEQPIEELAGASELLDDAHCYSVVQWHAQQALAQRWAGDRAPAAAQLTSDSHAAVTLAGHTARLPLAGPFVAHPYEAVWASQDGHFRWERPALPC